MAIRAGAPRQDDDGFIEVVHNATRRRRSREGSEEANADDGDAMDLDERQRTTYTEEGDDGEATCDHEATKGDFDDEDDHDDDEAGQQDLGEADPDVLRKRLECEQSMVRTLVREGVDEDHPAMVAAVAARSAAEEAWKAARRPHPVARRMGWAQQGLDRAMRARDKVREELAAFDEEMQERRNQIEQRLGQAMERVSKRRRALDELQEEAAMDVPAARRGHGAAEVCSELAGGMRSAIAPRVAALAAKLDDGSEAQEQFNLLVAQLEGLQGKLERHAHDGYSGHEEYWIADDRSEEAWSESHDLPGGNTREAGDTATASGARTHAGTHKWTSKGHGRWNKDGHGGARRTGKGTGQSGEPATTAAPAAMGTGTAGHGEATETARPTDTRADGCSASRAAGAGASQHRSGAGGHNRGRGGREDDVAPPPNKLHKGQSATEPSDACGSNDDDSRARELMQAQQEAAAAGNFGSQAAIQAAAQLHSQNVDKVTKAAVNQGVNPITATGDELIMLGPQELAQWAKDNLDGDKCQWW